MSDLKAIKALAYIETLSVNPLEKEVLKIIAQGCTNIYHGGWNYTKETRYDYVYQVEQKLLRFHFIPEVIKRRTIDDVLGILEAKGVISIKTQIVFDRPVIGIMLNGFAEWEAVQDEQAK